MTNGISRETIKRLPAYLRYLQDLYKTGTKNISSTVIATHFKANPVQVRKDLSCVSSTSGKPRTGFSVAELIVDISNYLGYDEASDAILVGVGQLGRTLLSYQGFANYGLRIIAGFDENRTGCSEVDCGCVMDAKSNAELLERLKADGMTCKSRVNGKCVFSMSQLPDLVNRLHIKIGIITVPKSEAQGVADLLVASGIRAIWNFAPTQLKLPQNVVVKYEDMAASLALLSNTLKEKMKGKQ
ncbi:MAG: redox-sensing transcriptional repressor Rex [Bacillota bacterium]